MNVSFGKIAIVGAALATLGYGLAEFRGPNGYSGLIQKREQVQRLEAENTRLRAELDRLDKRVDKLKHDPASQELEIRKRLGLVKAGETVYVLQEPKQSSKPNVQPETR